MVHDREDILFTFIIYGFCEKLFTCSLSKNNVIMREDIQFLIFYSEKKNRKNLIGDELISNISNIFQKGQN